MKGAEKCIFCDCDSLSLVMFCKHPSKCVNILKFFLIACMFIEMDGLGTGQIGLSLLMIYSYKKVYLSVENVFQK